MLTRFTKQPFAYAVDFEFSVAHGLQTSIPDCAEIKGVILMELSVHGLTRAICKCALYSCTTSGGTRTTQTGAVRISASVRRPEASQGSVSKWSRGSKCLAAKWPRDEAWKNIQSREGCDWFGNQSEASSQPLLVASADRSLAKSCLLYTSPSPRDKRQSRMPSSA